VKSQGWIVNLPGNIQLLHCLLNFRIQRSLLFKKFLTGWEVMDI